METTTGGSAGQTVRVNNFEDLKTYVGAEEPYVIEVQGTITAPNGYEKLNVASNKTIIGVDTATLDQIGFRVGGTVGCHDEFNASNEYVSNVIIRNLKFTNIYDTGASPDADGITIECFSHHVWADHNTFIYPTVSGISAGSKDGALDIKRSTDWITVSWNHFYHYDKTALLGHNDSNGYQDSGRLHVTYHHNYFENTEQRHPRVRFGKAHIFNNYLFNDKTGPLSQLAYFALAGPESELYIEANRLDVDSGELYIVSEDSDTGAKVTFTEDNIVNLLNASGEWLLEVDNDLAFNPRDYYEYTPGEAETLNITVPAYAGAGKL